MNNPHALHSGVTAINRAVALALLGLVAGQAGAQQAPADAAGLDEVVVTGSRIVRDGTTAPTPVTVVGVDLLQQRGINNVGEALNELPAFRPLVTPLTQQAVGGNVGAQVLDLRGLGGQRTLVLLDGKRFVPSTTVGTVDVNLIPSLLLKRTEVVTGGASAAYGSDAVAGVVNFLLDTGLEGFKGQVQYGRSQRGDALEKNLSLAFGTGFAEGRGHFIAAVEYNDADGMGDCYVRDWCPREQAVPNSAGWNGLPATLRIGPDAPGNLNQDGLINTTSGPLRGITFNRDGSIRNYQYGQIFGTNLSPLFTLGGEGTYENGYLQGINLLPPVERKNLFAQADYEFSDDLRGSLAVSAGQVKGLVVGSQARATNFAIARDNAFLPSAVATIMDANAIGSFTLGRVFGDLGGSRNNADNRTYRVVAALEGDFTDRWGWDGYYQYGVNEFRQDYTGNVVITRMRNAIDTVSVGGVLKCRVNSDAVTTNDDAACVPFNVFGRGRFDPAARAYVAPSGYQQADTTQHVLAMNTHGTLATLPGGDLAVAAGIEYRSDEIEGKADTLSSTNQLWSFNGKAINGKLEVAEGYVEAVAPLFTGFELNGALRQTSYDRSSPGKTASSVDVTTWKAGLSWQALDALRVRATKSRDIRAPNITELFGPVQAGRVTILDPLNPANNQIQINSLSGSNTALAPEKADSWTAGLVYTPDWGPLRLSADYFNVQIDGAIATLGAQVVVNRCAAGATEFCPFVSRDSSNLLTLVQDVLQNVNRQVNRGLDIEASYRSDLGGLGSLDYRLLATRYFELSTKDSVGVTDRVGQTGYRPGTTTGVPDWMVNANVNWKRDALQLGVQARYIPQGIFDTTLKGPEDAGYDVTKSNSISSNRVASRLYFDLNGSYELQDGLEFYGVIDNLLDKDPPLAASAQGGTNHVYFDPIGRYFKIGMRLKR